MPPIYLECVSCLARVDHRKTAGVCPKCGSMLSAKYDMEKAKETLTPRALSGRVKSLWRYREVLPVEDDSQIVTLGEGFTPLLNLQESLLLKDDGQIPTGTFKARGLSVAVSRAKELGLHRLAIPSAGNAGAALACYAARAGMAAKVFMPEDSPLATIVECNAYGAETVLVKGHIGDAARELSLDKSGFFDLSTLKEPYRLEGKKTMGYEIAEQLGFSLPDAILYPTGGGTGLIGMWKAFNEMEELGLIGNGKPRMFSVQAEGCAPIVAALRKGDEDVGEPFQNPHTLASGLRVPKPFAAKQILEVIRKSGGGAVAVSDERIVGAMMEIASSSGVLPCPEGAATFAAYGSLRDQGKIGRDEEVLLYNTGSGLKYLELLTGRLGIPPTRSSLN